jgi:hypothetical protein
MERGNIMTDMRCEQRGEEELVVFAQPSCNQAQVMEDARCS